MRGWKQVLIAPVAAVVLTAAVAALARADEGGRKVYQQTVQGTALVVTPAGDAGSAWVVDRERKLLVTAHHVVRDGDGDVRKVHDTVQVVFPEFRNGRPVAEFDHYLLGVEPPFQVKEGVGVRGEVLDTDPGRDLALIVVESLPETARALPLAAESPWPGDRVHVVGNPLGERTSKGLWVYNSGTVRDVYRKSKDFEDGQKINAMVVDISTSTYHGDSGGPVVNDAGEVVGVVSHGCGCVGLVNSNIEASEVKAFLTEARKLVAPRTAADFLRRGNLYKDKARYARALADYTTAIRLDPKSAEAFAQRAWVHDELGEFEAAIADATRAIKLDPKNAFAYTERSYAYNETGDYDKAVADADAAIRIDPDDATAHQNRGWALYHRGDLDGALAALSKAIELNPKSVGAFKGRALVYRERKEFDEAVADYDAIVELKPRDADAYYQRGLTRAAQGERDLAIEDYGRAIEINGSFAEAFEKRGDALAEKGDLVSARDDYNEALLIGSAELRQRVQEKLDKLETKIRDEEAGIKDK